MSAKITASSRKLVFEVSANDFVEAQTRSIAKEFKCSRPRPRNRAMGFRGEDRKRRTLRTVVS
jgi:hypothetical protein